MGLRDWLFGKPVDRVIALYLETAKDGGDRWLWVAFENERARCEGPVQGFKSEEEAQKDAESLLKHEHRTEIRPGAKSTFPHRR